MRVQKIFFHACVLTALFCAPAHALISPTPIATDNRIKTIMYSPNEVFKFTGYYRYQTGIEFGSDEEIATITLGDSVPWQLNPMGNRLFIKPIEKDAETNMTVITNKHTYLFELHAQDATSITDKNLIFSLRFIYPGEGDDINITHLDHVPDLEKEDLNKYNFKYTLTGSENIAPIRIFDDGEFTYFQFHDVNGEIPAFFQVDSSGHESLINYRARGPYIVVERVAAQFTLRHGNSVVCVFNEARTFNKKKSSGWFSSSSSSSDATSISTPVALPPNAAIEK